MKSKSAAQAFVKHFQNVCDMCRLYNANKNPLPTNSLQARETILSLKKIADLLSAEVITDNFLGRLEVTYSQGASIFPRVPWVAIVPTGKKVSNSPSIALCFGRKGNGGVAGLMVPATSSCGLAPIVRKGDPIDFIDLNSGKSTTNYNNKFVNPLEIPIESTDLETIKAHMKQSIALFGYE